MNSKSHSSEEYRPRLWRATKLWAKDIYENLGVVCAISFIDSFFLLAAFFLSKGPLVQSFIMILAIFTAICPLSFGATIFAHKKIYNLYPSLGDLAFGYRFSLAKSVGLGFLNLIFLWLAFAGFSMSLFEIKSFEIKSGMWLAIMAAVFFYAGIFWFGTLIYQLPLIALQNSGIFSTLRKSCLMVLDNPLFTVGAIFVIISFTILCALPAYVGFVVVYFGALPFFCVRASRELFIKYGLVDPYEDQEFEDHSCKLNP